MAKSVSLFIKRKFIVSVLHNQHTREHTRFVIYMIPMICMRIERYIIRSVSLWLLHKSTAPIYMKRVSEMPDKPTVHRIDNFVLHAKKKTLYFYLLLFALLVYCVVSHR